MYLYTSYRGTHRTVRIVAYIYNFIIIRCILCYNIMISSVVAYIYSQCVSGRLVGHPRTSSSSTLLLLLLLLLLSLKNLFESKKLQGSKKQEEKITLNPKRVKYRDTLIPLLARCGGACAYKYNVRINTTN